MRITMLAMLALAIPTVATAEPKADAGKKDPSKVVCRTESVTGSRLGSRKRCHTAGEWAEMARLDRESLERTQALRWKGNESMSGGAVDPFGRMQ